MDKHYPISCYDKYLSLKVSGMMWLVFLFLLGPIVVTLLSVVNTSDPMQLIDMVYPDRLTLSLGAFAAIPTALLIYSWTKRAPGASTFMKFIWQKGRIILLASIVLNVAVIFTPLALGTAYKIPTSGWVRLAINMWIAYVVVTSRYMKDCFSDFPEGNK